MFHTLVMIAGIFVGMFMMIKLVTNRTNAEVIDAIKSIFTKGSWS